jgi:hypothetical protein
MPGLTPSSGLDDFLLPLPVFSCPGYTYLGDGVAGVGVPGVFFTVGSGRLTLDDEVGEGPRGDRKRSSLRRLLSDDDPESSEVVERPETGLRVSRYS